MSLLHDRREAAVETMRAWLKKQPRRPDDTVARMLILEEFVKQHPDCAATMLVDFLEDGTGTEDAPPIPLDEQRVQETLKEAKTCPMAKVFDRELRPRKHGPAKLPHKCPYKVEIKDDVKSRCTCCDECETDCRMSI